MELGKCSLKTPVKLKTIPVGINVQRKTFPPVLNPLASKTKATTGGLSQLINPDSIESTLKPIACKGLRIANWAIDCINFSLTCAHPYKEAKTNTSLFLLHLPAVADTSL